MAKLKKASKVAATDRSSEGSESKSMIPEEGPALKEAVSVPEIKAEALEGNDTESSIRILFHGSCPKLTTRGVGELEYEIGIDDETDEPCLRITGNASSGAFSNKWVGVSEIRTILEDVPGESFRAIILRDLYFKRSSNNHGYLAAILKTEGVLVNLPKQPTVLCLAKWEPLLEKINSLNEEGISLTDHIAVAVNKRAERRAELLSDKQAGGVSKAE